MPAPLTQPQRAYIMRVFADLLKTRNQKQLAEVLGVDQSRVSLGKTRGRVGPILFQRAAELAGRPRDEVAAVLGITSPSGSNDEQVEQDDPAETTRDVLLDSCGRMMNATDEDIAAVLPMFSGWPYIENDADSAHALMSAAQNVYIDLRRSRRAVAMECELRKLLAADPARLEAVTAHTYAKEREDADFPVDYPKRG